VSLRKQIIIRGLKSGKVMFHPAPAWRSTISKILAPYRKAITELRMGLYSSLFLLDWIEKS